MKHLPIAVLLVCLAAMPLAAYADVPPDLADAVEYQKKNKDAVIQRLQQRLSLYELQKDAKGARDTTKAIQAVRANKSLVLPSMGEAGDLPGTISVEKILEKEGAGYRIQTSLPRLEDRGRVNIRRGTQVAAPQLGQEFIYYPEKVFVTTSRELKDGDRINVRKTEAGFSEIPEEELNDAAKLLKKK